VLNYFILGQPDATRRRSFTSARAAGELLTATIPTICGQATASDKQQRVFLRADKTVPYGDLMALMNDLHSAGYLHVALVALETVKAP